MRHVSKLTALSLLALFAVGCGGKSGGDSGGTAEAPPGDTAVPPNTVVVADPTPNPNATPGPETPLPVALYEPKNVPQTFSVAIPGAIAVETSAQLHLQGEIPEETPPEATTPEAEAPDQDTSHGLSELRFQIQTLQDRIGYLTQNFMLADQVIEANKADCADGCTIPNATAKLSAEMVSLMIRNSGGEEAMTDADIESFKSAIGEDIPLGTVSLALLTDDPDGYTKTLKVENEMEGDTWSYGMSFSADFKAVAVFEKSDSTFEDPMGGDPMTNKSDYRFTYDAAKGSMNVTDKSDWSGSKYENSFLLQTDPEAVATNGLFFNVKIEYVSSEGDDGYYMELNGLADNEGAYIRTLYAFDTYDTTFELSSDDATPYTSYSVVSVGVTAADLNADPQLLWSVEQGSFSGADSGGTAAYAFYNGPNAANFPAGGLPIVERVQDDVTFVETFVDATFHLASVTQTKTRVNSGYEEYVGSDGQVQDHCYYEADGSGNVDWEAEPYFCTSDDISSDYSSGYYEEVGEGGEFIPEGAKLVSVTNAFMSAVEGEDILIFRDSDSITAANALLAAEDYETEWDGYLGFGSYVGPDYGEISDPSTAPVGDYYYFSYWSAEDGAGAKAATWVFDENDGWLLVEISGAVVTVTEAQ